MENSNEENRDSIPLNDDERIEHAEENVANDEDSPEEQDDIDETEEHPTGRNICLRGVCLICWENLAKNPLASTICGHVFCLDCLEKSLKIVGTCPTCRQTLEGPSAYHPLYLKTPE